MASTDAGTRWRGTTGAERDAARRERLLAAGLELMGTRGYAATTVEAICAAASVSTRNFYDHFADREALLRAIYDDVVADVQRRALATFAQAPEQADVRALVRSALEPYHRTLDEDPRKARIVLVDTFGISDDLEAHRVAVVDGFAQLIAAAARLLMQRGLLPPRDDLGLAPLALAGASDAIMIARVHGRDDRPLDAVLDELADLYLTVLTAPPSAR